MTKRKANKDNYVGQMLNMGVTNLVGVGMIGATAGMVNDLPVGTAKTVAGIVPGLQSVSLVGANLGMMNSKQNHLNKSKNKKLKW